MQVGDHSPVHSDVIIVTEIAEVFSGELSAVVGDDRVRDSKTKNGVLDENHGLLGANLS
jgi:hypothetical protein